MCQKGPDGQITAMGQTSLNAVDTYSLAECPKYPYAYESDMVMCVLYLSGHIFIIIGVN
jgi:hypothetical protein